MDTPRFLATSLGGTPLASSFLADSILLSVIFGLRPPLRPSCYTERKALACCNWEVVNWRLRPTSESSKSGPHANCTQPSPSWYWQRPTHRISLRMGFKACPYTQLPPHPEASAYAQHPAHNP